MASSVGVSAREAEVLAALGEHLTNAEIAARLFISVRTVESHVSSLLRKLQVIDRRALAVAAVTMGPAGPALLKAGLGLRAAAGLPLPSPLTSFVGRVAERAALAAALATNRLVTAVGPGGVGKTRLALSVVTDVADRYADGVWYVDLVPVTDPAMVAPAIAAALGLGERQGRSDEDIVLGWLAPRETLLVLDNCEHLLDGMPGLLERLLAGSSRLSVLVTSRARLLVPFEWVFPVPGLSVEARDGGPGDAVELFEVRAAAAGSPLTPDDSHRVAAVCRGLDGVALAIELTAARFPSLGLDGIEAGLADRMNLLTGGRRADDRHRSLQSALDWSYALLDEADQAVLRRVSVFAAPFSSAAAEMVCGGWPPADAVPAALARLTEQSLLVATPDGSGTLSFTRGFPGESQRRYEQAAELAPDAGHVATVMSPMFARGPSADSHLKPAREVGQLASVPTTDRTTEPAPRCLPPMPPFLPGGYLFREVEFTRLFQYGFNRIGLSVAPPGRLERLAPLLTGTEVDAPEPHNPFGLD